MTKCNVEQFPRRGPLDAAMDRVEELLNSEFPNANFALVITTKDHWALRRIIWCTSEEESAQALGPITLLGGLRFLGHRLEHYIEADDDG